MTEDDFEALRARWPNGWYEMCATDDGVHFDNFFADDDGGAVVPRITITLQPNGDWTRHQDGRLIAKGETLAAIL